MQSEADTKSFKTGTTTLAIAATDGVVLAAEKRATMGHLIGHKDTQKLFQIDTHLGLTTAGLVGDLQALTRYLTAEVQLYRFKRDQPMPVRAAATLMANILNRTKFMPFYVQLIIGGFNGKEGRLYSIDASGGAIPETWTCTGSGSMVAYGVMEDHMRDSISVKDAVDVAVRALNAAMRRDSASGDGMSVAIIDKDGYRRLSDEELAKRHKALKLPVSFV